MLSVKKGALCWCEKKKVVNGSVNTCGYMDLQLAYEEYEKLKNKGVPHVWVEEAWFPVVENNAMLPWLKEEYGHDIVETRESCKRFFHTRNSWGIKGPATGWHLHLFGNYITEIKPVYINLKGGPENHGKIVDSYVTAIVYGRQIFSGCLTGIMDDVLEMMKNKTLLAVNQRGVR